VRSLRTAWVIFGYPRPDFGAPPLMPGWGQRRWSRAPRLELQLRWAAARTSDSGPKTWSAVQGSSGRGPSPQIQQWVAVSLTRRARSG
jgi:hypothetical protein